METRLSYVTNINSIKRKLWDSAYSYIENMNMLAKSIYASFWDTGILEKIEFNFVDMRMELHLLRQTSNEDLNSYITKAFEQFAKDMYECNNISKEELEICQGRANMLFNLVLNTNDFAIITL